MLRKAIMRNKFVAKTGSEHRLANFREEDLIVALKVNIYKLFFIGINILSLHICI